VFRVVRRKKRSPLFWDITQGIVVIPYRRFGTIYRFQLQRVKNSKKAPKVCPDTSVRKYHHTLYNIPEDRRFHLLHGESLKSRTGGGIFPKLLTRTCCCKLRGITYKTIQCWLSVQYFIMGDVPWIHDNGECGW
jgi:hypothetical protein